MRCYIGVPSSLFMFRMLVYILVLLTVSDGALLLDETLSQRFLQLCMLKMLLYILVR
jgi:hypothetical protein